MDNYLLVALLVTLGISICKAQDEDLSDFLPEGYKEFERYYGDLNKDGEEDCILIIKATSKDNVVINRFDQEVDRNRRGIIVLFKEQDGYQLADKNYDCFSSENEDGGVYFPPELSIEVERGNLVIHYGHGRYGFWRYIFRFQNAAFELIGYDSADHFGPRVNRETSINFLTRQKLVRENINENSEGGDEVFEEMWEEIDAAKLIQLSEVESFEYLNF